ncbi:MAG: hypothetical protein RLO50_19705 [Azospirillaceae bacterium]
MAYPRNDRRPGARRSWRYAAEFCTLVLMFGTVYGGFVLGHGYGL